MKRNQIYWSMVCLMVVMLSWGATLSAAEERYKIQGKVMDTSDNWLNGATVTLARMGAKTKTDANGEFTLEFTLQEPLESSQRNNLAVLMVAREGHISQRIPIKSVDYFAKPIEVKLEPQAIDSALIGFSVEMEAPKGRKGTTAEFHVFIPESVKTVRAAFYISRHGMGDITKPVLQKFAEQERVALVGMYGDPVQRGVEDVAELDQYIEKLAKLSGHPELTEVPVMTFGHSNGTGFAASWPRDRPERCIAWIGFHPGFNNYLQFSNSEKVPAMIMCGTVDKYLLKSRQDKVVADMRKTRNAAMQVMMEGGVGHGPADQEATWVFITEFLKAAMRVRLQDDGSMKPVEIEEGWLGAQYHLEKGGRQNLEVAPYRAFKGEKSTANWLPDEEFAHVWQSYGKKAPDKKR